MLLLLITLVPRPAQAAPIVLRLATAAPDGTAWARLMRARGRDLEAESGGAASARWYFGGIAGDELGMLDRMKRGQLDGVLSGGVLCMRLSPSMKVLRLLGMFQSRDESSYVLGRLRPAIDAEFHDNGFENLGEAGLGSDIIFSRTPITTLFELKHARLWMWDLDDALLAQLTALGGAPVPLPLQDAARAYDEKRTDGFIAVATAALAFQWSAQTKYLTELRMGFLPGCMVLTNRAFDSLSLPIRQALKVSAARFQSRLDDLGRSQDIALLGSLFAKQGVKTVPVSATFSSEFFEAARIARESLRDKIIPGPLLDRVSAWLADYRGEHANDRPHK